MTAVPLGAVSRTGGTVRLERTFDASAERVWLMCTDPSNLGRWLGAVEQGAPGEGATFVLRMDTDETATCSVTTWSPPRLLELTWDYTGEGRSRVRLELTPDGNRTVLRLDHDQLPGDSAPAYGAGWQLYLEVLAAVLADHAPPDFAELFPPLLVAYENLGD